MHNEFDSYERIDVDIDSDAEKNGLQDFMETENKNPCTDCPYLMRQLPVQPFIPPRPRPPYPGNYGNQPPRPRPPYGYPPGPPPSFAPSISQKPGTQAVSPGSIRYCIHRFVYIQLNNGRTFWAWLTMVDRWTASGFRWNGRRWVYFGIDLRRIASFECY